MTSREEYQSAQKKHQELFARYHAKAKQLAILRIANFISAIIGFVYLVNIRELGFALLFLLALLLLFALLVNHYNKIIFQREQQRFLVDINQEELNRLEGNFAGLGSGQEFSDEHHDYANDLDIFGVKSVFQLLNRTSTYPGKLLLKQRLLGTNMPENLTAVQESVGELSRNLPMIQEYQALGRHVQAEANDYLDFRHWVDAPKKIRNAKYLSILLWLLPVLFLVSFALVEIYSVTYYFLLPQAVINALLLGKYHKYSSEVVENTSASIKLLKSFSYHILLLENQKFQSPFLQDLCNTFSKDGLEAGKEIKRLGALLDNLQSRNNMLHVFINIPFLLDLQWLWRIEAWHDQNRSNLDQWFNTLAEFEVLVSLAGQSFAQKGWVYPEFSNEPYDLACKNVGHPLINEAARQTNDFEFQGDGQIIILTGPNMAGKSTFLRTIGVNLVLAKMGGVVCATSFRVNPKYVPFTSMRIKDDLSESVSSFYAELARIKQLLAHINQGIPVLFFLDEILKGTNSADRHKGAEALIRQLSSNRVSGFVSTHDIELGGLTKELTGVSNYSFESTIANGKIEFDYKLRPGICSSFNACELMRQMGIEV